MISEPIEHCIIKYFSKSASREELDKLSLWLNASSSNKEAFKKYVKINYLIEFNLKDFETDIEINQVLSKIAEAKNSKTKKVIKLKYKYIAIAASILLLISLTFFFNSNDSNALKPIVVNNNIKKGTDKAILTLDDGTTIALEKGQNYNADNLSSNGKEIIYKSSPSSKSEIAYNYLTIPRGGQYFVKLADGTRVWLNSESKLKYPTAFIDSEDRNVELIYGEAYFDVSPSTLHGGSTFKVFTGTQNIAVLGTEFNIKAYQDEDTIFTTLIEGKIAVDNNKNSYMLSPNQQSIINHKENSMQVKTITDIFSVTAWKKGAFSLKDMPLHEIMKVLSRWYDTEIVFLNDDTKHIKFSGILGREQAIKDILSTISYTSNVTYEIKEKTIIFK